MASTPGLRDYQRKRVHDAQLNTLGAMAPLSDTLTPNGRLRMANKVVNGIWWRQHAFVPDGVMLFGTGCVAKVAGERVPIACGNGALIYPNHRSVRRGEIVTIVVPETATTEMDVYHALVHTVPLEAKYVPEPPHGPGFARHLVAMTMHYNHEMGVLLHQGYAKHKVSTDSILSTERADKLADVQRRAAVKHAKVRASTINSLLEKLRKLDD